MKRRQVPSGAAVLVAGFLAGCGGGNESHYQLAQRIGQGIVAACPVSSPSDEQARALCSAKLTSFTLMRDTMVEPFHWGGQKAGKGYRLADNDTTRFNALVWRRMYLSTFMFTGAATLEQSGDFIVIHLPVQFRGQMDAGAYPYPFWHSKTKWDSYQLTTEVVLIMEDGKLTGGLRSSVQDPTKPYVAHAWAGQWRWQEGGQEMPYVSLYKYLLSNTNPYAARLDKAFRALSGELRSNACFVCHSPDNGSKISDLEFFNLPNQALYSRHSIVQHLTMNTMPPKNDLGLPMGMADDKERADVLNLAKEFEAAGDAALAYEGELKPAQPLPPEQVQGI